ncbi:pyridoxamine 5'-phosphate oxidase family protein [Peptoniphilus ovalis]|uniref:pyridoxamine 5'-phosphate oxidase family protein n=1 Tax=Peptoniphilus ovalis TaxID=2841503 RepID=UPI001FEB8BC7|nr:pyridoxamine 5'-phosphate oxidase family protein [Peptoniphilus ovalis]
MPIEDAKDLLEKSPRGVLSFNGEDDYPYSIPMNYHYNRDEGKIYFHSAKVGYKVDCINKNNKACFVTFGDKELSEDGWSHYVSSTIVFGKIEIIEDRKLLLEKIKEFAIKYYPSMEEVEDAIERSINGVLFYCLNIEHISVKRVRER